MRAAPVVTPATIWVIRARLDGTNMTVASPLSASAGPLWAVLPWRMNGAPRVTIAVKVCYRLTPAGAVLAEAEPIVMADQFREGSSSLLRPSEMAPFLPGTGVLLVGQACAPGGRPIPSLSVRLALYRGDQPLLDKVLHVVGDRAHSAAAPAPFVRMPIVYERAYGGSGVETNPVGTGQPGPPPNILHPTHPERPAGFGPVARHWAPRRYLHPGPRADAPAPELSGSVDFRYFHAAPLDQQIAPLLGNERIFFENLHPHHPQVTCILPGFRAGAHVVRGGSPVPVDLVADTLWIDAAALTATLIFRGSIALAHGEEPAGLRVETWLSPAPERASVLPQPQASPPAETAPGRKKPMLQGGQLTIDPPAAPRGPVAPFAIAQPGAEDRQSTVPVAGTPWSPESPPVKAPAARHDLRETQAVTGEMAPPDRPQRSSLRETAPDKGPSAAAPLPFSSPEPGVSPAISELSLGPGRTRSVLGTGTLQAPDQPSGAGSVLPFAPLPASSGLYSMTGNAPSASAQPPLTSSIPTSPAVSAPLPLTGSMPSPPAASAPLSLTESMPSLPMAAAPPPLTSSIPSSPAGAGITPAAPAPKGLRDVVIARLEAKESLRDLALAGATLDEIDFGAVSLDRQSLAGASLRGCNLAGANLSQANLSGADLSLAVLSNADLSGADLSRTTLTKARLDGARLDGASLSAASANGASFAGASLVRADMRQARLLACSLERARMDDALAGKVDLSASSLAGASLRGASLRAARLKDVLLTSADVTSADMRDADLSRANVHGAQLSSAKTGGANLRGVVDTPPLQGAFKLGIAGEK